MSKNKEAIEYMDDAGNIVKGELPKNLGKHQMHYEMKKYIYDQYNALAKQKAWDAWS